MDNIATVDLQNFITFHVKKGKEQGGIYDDMVTVRSLEYEKAVKDDLLFMITCEGEEGAMVITPSAIDDLMLFKTEKKFRSKEGNYALARVHWEPTHISVIQALDRLYSYQRSWFFELEEGIRKIKQKWFS